MSDVTPLGTGFVKVEQLANYVLRADLASRVHGLGASLIGVEDAGSHYVSKNVEGILAEIGGGGGGGGGATYARLASTAHGDGASLIGIEDAGGFYVATTTEGALAAIGAKLVEFGLTTLDNGASLIGVNNATALFTQTTVQGVLEHDVVLGLSLASTTITSGATMIGVNANGGMFSEADLQHVLQEDVVLRANASASDGTGGASLIGVQDVANHFGGLHVLETVLAYIGSIVGTGGFQTIANPSTFTLASGHTLAVALSDAATNTATALVENITHASSGTTDIGFGFTEKRQLQNASGTMKDAVVMSTSWLSATAGTEATQLDIQIPRGGASTGLPVTALKLDGSQQYGFLFGSRIITLLQIGDTTGGVGFGAGAVGVHDAGSYFGGPTDLETALQAAGLHISQRLTIANPATITLSTGNTLTVALSDAATNTATALIESLTHATSGTAAVGFGMTQKRRLQNAAGTMKDASAFVTKWKTATAGSEETEIDIQGMTAGTLTTFLTLSEIGCSFSMGQVSINGSNIITALILGDNTDPGFGADAVGLRDVGAYFGGPTTFVEPALQVAGAHIAANTIAAQRALALNLAIPAKAGLQLCYDALNVDKLGDLSLTDGAAQGTWNSVGGLQDSSGALTQSTPAAKAIFRKIATAGKQGDLSAMDSPDGARAMVSGALSTSLTSHFIVGILFYPTSTAVTTILVDSGTGNLFQVYLRPGGSVNINGGTQLQSSNTVTVNAWNCAIVEYNGASSNILLNGTLTSGTAGVTGAMAKFVLFNEYQDDGGTPGMIAWAGAWMTTLPALTDVNNYLQIRSNIASFPQ